MNKIYFKNLNGLRFFAALAVIIHHVEQYKSIYGYENYWETNLIKNLGNLGVQFFFVLSGFLITFLLMKEKETTNKINYKYFIRRRIYRIWPLYFIIVILSLFIAPNIDLLNLPSTNSIFDSFYTKLIFLCFFLPNVAFRAFTPISLASQTWSIGVEEQFYVIWPILIKKIRFLYQAFLFLFIGYLLIKFSVFKLSVQFPDISVASKIINDLSISGFIFGAIGANILMNNNQSILKVITNIYFLRITFLLFILLIFLTSSESYYFIGVISIENEIFCFLFAIFIVNLVANKNLYFSFEKKGLNYLGKISYGLYMYHPICIACTFNILKKTTIISTTFIYPFTIALTILLAGLSYHLIENKFLRLKKY